MQPPSRDPLEPVFPPASPPMSPLVYRTPVKPPDELPVLSNRAIVWAAVVLLVLGLGLAAGLLVAFGGGQNTAQLDAIKTAGTIVLGTGGAAALWLTARRQRTSELSLNQAYAAHLATVADAEARRITDLYGKAADQLGSAQAPTRLAGLYALERLAQDNPAQRQTIVDLLCAYLRMPYEPPPRKPVRRPAAPRSGVSRPLLGSAARRRSSVRLTPPAPRVDTPTGAATAAEQEHQVRRTAQAILFRHLRAGDKEKPVDTFWSDINLDLTGALLGPANLIGARIVAADFTGATFTGDVWFSGARFGLDAVFTGVRFAGNASFSGARFDHSALFGGVTFDDWARFKEADFRGAAKFSHAEFRSGTEFAAATFARQAWFDDARFTGWAQFDKARFAGRGVFGGAHFAENAYFTDAKFNEDAHFHQSRFTGAYTQFCRASIAQADFRTTEFGLNADFTDARFTDNATFDLTKFTGHVDFGRATFDNRADFDDARFTGVVTFEDAEFHGDTRFHNCHFSQSTMFRRTRFAADLKFTDTVFAEGAGFVETMFGGRAQFIGTSFDDATGFPRARFGGNTTLDYVHFGGPVGFTGTNFAKPPQIRTVWVRLDGRKLDVDSTWPPDTVIREIDQRPHGVHEGRWALLVPTPPDEAAVQE